MRRQRSSTDPTVLEILRRRPAAAEVLIRLGTQCVGCALAGFCTPGDVARAYRLDGEALRRLLLADAPPSL